MPYYLGAKIQINQFNLTEDEKFGVMSDIVYNINQKLKKYGYNIKAMDISAFGTSDMIAGDKQEVLIISRIPVSLWEYLWKIDCNSQAMKDLLTFVNSRRLKISPIDVYYYWSTFKQYN